MILRTLTYTIVFVQGIHNWLIEFHQITLALALRDLQPEHEKLLQLITAYHELGISSDSTYIASLPDIARDRIPFKFFDNMHGSFIFGTDSSGKNIALNPNTVNFSLDKSIGDLTNFLLSNKDKNLFYKVFFLPYLIHFIGEFYQPYHTSKNSGHDVYFEEKGALHPYWDGGCGYLQRGNSKESASFISNLVENKTPIKIGKINITLEERKTTPSNSITDWVNELTAFYNKKSLVDLNKPGLSRGQYLFSADLKSHINHENYKPFCVEIAASNLYVAGKRIGYFLGQFFKNNPNLKRGIKELLAPKNETDRGILGKVANVELRSNPNESDSPGQHGTVFFWVLLTLAIIFIILGVIIITLKLKGYRITIRSARGNYNYRDK